MHGRLCICAFIQCSKTCLTVLNRIIILDKKIFVWCFVGLFNKNVFLSCSFDFPVIVNSQVASFNTKQMFYLSSL
jgi:hypothetical protein